MTEDKKQKIKDYQKQYRENMTDEQKQKSREYQKKYRKAKKLNNKIAVSAKDIKYDDIKSASESNMIIIIF